MPMSEKDINRILKQVWALTTSAGMSVREATELHSRALISLALNTMGGDPMRAAALIKGIAEDIINALTERQVKVTHVVQEKQPDPPAAPPPPPPRRRGNVH